MGDAVKPPSDCTSMTELRTTIDAVDRKLVELLRLRQDCIDRAIELKPGEGLPARIESRVVQVVANVRASSLARGLDPDFAEMLWRSMIEWSISREEGVLGTGDAPAAAPAQDDPPASEPQLQPARKPQPKRRPRPAGGTTPRRRTPRA